ncbi:hypothetical protein ccbrp13_63860 [Ktedonobacteria bacterium brp13]|nr:hypothetical protein ccbrp13_63860 [Ktedonobacteria bacterium brp13]
MAYKILNADDRQQRAGFILRGTSSHFNFTTPFDSVVFETMGGAVAVLWLAGAVLAVFLLLQRLPDPAWAWALRFSIIIALAGILAACLMLVSTPSQMASIPQKIMGAHSVGVADGGPGLPILGWSTVGGDLRIPHFFGLHSFTEYEEEEAFADFQRKTERKAETFNVVSNPIVKEQLTPQAPVTQPSMVMVQALADLEFWEDK